jgi:hypothetical protein
LDDNLSFYPNTSSGLFEIDLYTIKMAGMFLKNTNDLIVMSFLNKMMHAKDKIQCKFNSYDEKLKLLILHKLSVE